MLLSPKTPVPIKETPSNDKMDGTAVAFNSSVKENSDKTTLINRIAKLGQPILPLSGPIVADDSDSEQVSNENCNLLKKKAFSLNAFSAQFLDN